MVSVGVSALLAAWAIEWLVAILLLGIPMPGAAVMWLGAVAIGVLLWAMARDPRRRADALSRFEAARAARGRFEAERLRSLRESRASAIERRERESVGRVLAMVRESVGRVAARVRELLRELRERRADRRATAPSNGALWGPAFEAGVDARGGRRPAERQGS